MYIWEGYISMHNLERSILVIIMNIFMNKESSKAIICIGRNSVIGFCKIGLMKLEKSIRDNGITMSLCYKE